jgi:hypothetical protein
MFFHSLTHPPHTLLLTTAGYLLCLCLGFHYLSSDLIPIVSLSTWFLSFFPRLNLCWLFSRIGSNVLRHKVLERKSSSSELKHSCWVSLSFRQILVKILQFLMFLPGQTLGEVLQLFVGCQCLQ